MLHELGHFVLHYGKPPRPAFSDPRVMEEAEANIFAVYVLYPMLGYRQEALANYWGHNREIQLASIGLIGGFVVSGLTSLIIKIFEPSPQLQESPACQTNNPSPVPSILASPPATSSTPNSAP